MVKSKGCGDVPERRGDVALVVSVVPSAAV